jgi:GTPase Era involved in 16S rRNA processing
VFGLRRAPSIRRSGETLNEIGSAARREMELLLGTKVFSPSG